MNNKPNVPKRQYVIYLKELVKRCKQNVGENCETHRLIYNISCLLIRYIPYYIFQLVEILFFVVNCFNFVVLKMLLYMFSILQYFISIYKSCTFYGCPLWIYKMSVSYLKPSSPSYIFRPLMIILKTYIGSIYYLLCISISIRPLKRSYCRFLWTSIGYTRAFFRYLMSKCTIYP